MTQKEPTKLEFVRVGYVTLPDGGPSWDDDVYELYTDKGTHTARCLTNVTGELKWQIRALERSAKPIDDVMRAVQEGKES